MTINLRTCSAEELWKYVSAQLSRYGTDAVLVGGAVVSIYSEGAYKSGDLDFVVRRTGEDLEKAMAEIGFAKKDRHYQHPACSHLFVEFTSTVLGIGEQHDIKPDEVHEGRFTFRILSPTDCIKDRLAIFIHDKSREGLDQALLVARNQPFNRNEVKRWCKNEKALHVYEEFETLLKQVPKAH